MKNHPVCFPLWAAITGALFAVSDLPAQLIVSSVAGMAAPSGIPAQLAAIQPTSANIAVSPSGAIVFGSNYRIRQIGTDGIIQTIAGTGDSGYSGDGGPALLARIGNIAYPKFDKAGNLYFFDSFRVRRIDVGGTITTIIGTGIRGTLGGDGPPASAQIDALYGMELDSVDNLYLVEGSGTRRLTPDGKIEVFSKGAGGGTSTMDPAGNLYFFQGQSVYRATPDGTVKPFAGQILTGKLTFGNIIAATSDQAGNIYAIEGTNNKIWFMTATGGGPVALTPGGGGLGGDIGVASITSIGGATENSFYITDGVRLRQFFRSTNSVQTLGGKDFLGSADGTPAVNAQLYYPSAIAVSRTGDLYIAETCRIQKIGSDGILATVGGIGNCASSDSVMAVDSRGTVYKIGSQFDTSRYVGVVVAVNADGTTFVVPGTDDVGLAPGASLAVDSSDRLYILASSGLRRWSAAGGMEVLGWEKKLPGNAVPGSMAIDAADRLYIQDANTFAVYRFGADGSSSGIVASFPISPRVFKGVWTVDRVGRVWTQNPFSNGSGGQPISGIQILGNSQVSEVIPCCGHAGDDGPAASARVKSVSAMAAAPNGDVYLLEGGIVRKISGNVPAQAPVISAAGIVNAVSYNSGPIAPGELISIYGSNFGQNGVRAYTPENNSVPITLGNVAVFFNGQHGTVTVATPNQINVFVPYEISAATQVSITVVVDGSSSNTVTVPVSKTAFGLVTADASGSGQGAILNQDATLNSMSNPARAGSVIVLYGTGEGVTTPTLPDGALVLSTPFSLPSAPVSVSIGGQQAKVLYAGAAPFLPTGVLQINAVIPETTPPGVADVVVSIGGVASNQSVTCAVQ